MSGRGYHAHVRKKAYTRSTAINAGAYLYGLDEG